MRKYTIFVLLLALLSIAVAPIIAQEGEEAAGPTSHLRVAHFSPDAPAVDVYVDGVLTVEALEFPDVSAWLELPTGNHAVAVTVSGSPIEEAVISADVPLPENGWITAAAIGQVGDGSLRPAVIVEDYSPLAAGSTRITFFNAIADLGLDAIDVEFDGAVAVDTLSLPGVVGDGAFTIETTGGNHTFRFLQGGNSLTAVTPNRNFAAGSNYLVAAVGTLSAGDTRNIAPVIVGVETRDIATIASQTADLSTLVGAAQVAGLVETLQGDGPYTVFAPTNNAFTDLIIALGRSSTDILADTELLSSTLMYHVVPGSVDSAHVAGSIFLDTALEGERIWIETDANGNLLLNGVARLVTTDIQATNGTIHIIDAVLLPTDGTIAQIAQTTPELSTLLTAVDTAGLTGDLQTGGPYTVFAPVNNAFTDLLIDAQISTTALFGDLDLLNSVLGLHVVEGVVSSADLSDGTVLTTVDGQRIFVESGDGGLVLNGRASIVQADVPARNGVVHVIDAVLLPYPDTAANELAFLPQFSTLATAVDAAGLTDALNSAEGVTIFAPNNNAFTNLIIDLQTNSTQLLADVETLNAVLPLHVVEGVLTSADLAGVESVTTLAGVELPVTVGEDGSISVGGVPVVTADIPARNGVIHEISGVILPADMVEAEEEPTEAPAESTEEADGGGEGAAVGTIIEAAGGAGNFTTLLAAVDAAGLTETLSGPGPFTVFAPTDDAFAALPQATLNVVLQTPDLLTSILSYHVLPEALLAEDLLGLESVTTVQGADIALSVDGETLVLNGTASVTTADIVASNGVIHVIDAVLLPPSGE